MTQKHFIAIAATIRARVEANRERLVNCEGQIKVLAEAQADYFASINPNFKRDRFMVSCGFGD